MLAASMMFAPTLLAALLLALVSGCRVITAVRKTMMSLGSEDYNGVQTQTGDMDMNFRPTMAVAKTGTLTTRTDNTTGTLTMTGGHGITTGAKGTLFWSGGRRTNVTVGTVATNSVPFSGGSGDNLPIATTAITFQVRNSNSQSITGDNVKAISVRASLASTIEFIDSGTPVLTVNLDAGGVYSWMVPDGTTNPLASADIDTVSFTQADSANVADIAAGVLLDN